VLKAHVTIERDSQGEFRLALVTELDGIVGERALTAHSCNSVVDAAAVTLALILNPDIDTSIAQAPKEGSAGPAREQAPAANAPANAQPVAAPPARSIESSREPVHWLATSALGLHFGVMPNPGPELTLGLGVGYRQWSVLALGSYAPPETVHLAGSPNAGARIWHGTLAGLGCWSFSLAAPRLGACVGAAVTRIHGHGVNVSYANDGSTSWVSPAGSLFGDLRLSDHTAFRLSGLVMHPLARPDTHLDNLGTVQRPSTLTALLQAGVIVQVP
jgi:hypothetical protein